MIRFVCLCMVCLVTVVCQAQQQAFSLRLEAPDAVKPLLEQHLELQAYRAVPDLSDSELLRLMALAQTQAQDLLATLGYFSPQVSIAVEPSANVRAERSVRVTVVPGTQTTVSDVHIGFFGAIADNPAAASQRQGIEGSWSLPVGMPFTQAQWDHAKQQVVNKLTERRFPAGRIRLSQADIDPDTNTARLHVELDSAALYSLGPVRVQGATRYGDALVTRIARLTPGADYAQSALVEAQQRLTDSGYFESAYLSLDLDSDPAQATVNALVREAALQKLVFGVGASTDTGARVSIEHTHNQVPGVGWRMVNKLAADRDTSSLSSDWTSTPDDSQWRWAVSGLLNTQRIGDIEVAGQRYRVGRFVLGQQLDHSYYLQLDRADVRTVGSDTANTDQALSANYAFTRRQFDSMPFPTEGWALGGEFALGNTSGSRAAPFTRVLLRGLGFLPLGSAQDTAYARSRAGRLALRAETGAVVIKEPDAIPFTQLFLAGGDNSVRGYQWQEIGVTSQGVMTNQAGRYLASGSVEWQRPIVWDGVVSQWEADVFVDGGAVADTADALEVRLGVGAGARWKSPVGPLQFDLAYGVAVQRLRAHVSIGFVF